VIKVTAEVMRVVQLADVGWDEAAPVAGPFTVRPRALKSPRGPEVFSMWRINTRRTTCQRMGQGYKGCKLKKRGGGLLGMEKESGWGGG